VSALNQKLGRNDLPECIRLTVNGKIVSAHCITCGAFVAASQSLDRLETAIFMHTCVREGH
jgi:hypothetical protein